MGEAVDEAMDGTMDEAMDEGDGFVVLNLGANAAGETSSVVFEGLVEDDIANINIDIIQADMV